MARRMTALDAAEALVDALGLRYGEVTVSVSDGELVLIRKGQTLRPADLAEIEVPPRRPRTTG